MGTLAPTQSRASLSQALLCAMPLHKENSMTLKRFVSSSIGVLVTVGAVVSMLGPVPASAAQTLVVSAGMESPGGDIQLNEFGPNQININVGDTITWRLDSTEFHNVDFPSGGTVPEFVQPGPDGVFINPEVAIPAGGNSYDGTGHTSSGLLNKGQTWSLTFTTAGTFPFVCDIHPGMGGVVNVQPAGQTADTQPSIDARRTALMNTELAQKGVPLVVANVGELPAEGVSAGIAAGVQEAQVDVQRFFPRRVTVKAGDAVTWILKTEDTPHTVTFLAGQPTPEVVVPQPQPAGPPKLQLNPQVLAPAGDPTGWDGGTYLNSGFLQPMPGQPTPTFTVRFPNAGTYDYVCVLHEGMVGTIVVEPAAE
jgi:plastocyanin